LRHIFHLFGSDQSESITETNGVGSGYAQCSSWGTKRSSGTVAIFNGDNTKSLENYQFRVDLLHDGSYHSSLGVVFRYQDAKNYYRVVVTHGCTSLIRVLNGVQTKISSHYRSSGGGYVKSLLYMLVVLVV
jgi:hypothetical protein